MSINEKMTAIADGVRALDGSTAALTLDGIAAGLAAEKSHVDAALVAIAGKGVTVPEGSKTASLATLIGSITGESSAPSFSYTGTHQYIDDGDGNWRIKFLTSGTLRFANLGSAANGIDVFLVGGGGNGASGNGGGGGGYTRTEKSILLQTDTDYEIIVGGSAGATSAFNYTAEAGGSATSDRGANGGSGGGAWSGGSSSSVNVTGNGGSDGSDGASYTWNNVYHAGGAGQGTTTREFAEDSGDLYAGGGGGTYGKGGDGGGGGWDSPYGETNTGGGGAGKAGANYAGGSGIVIVRNHREVVS